MRSRTPARRSTSSPTSRSGAHRGKFLHVAPDGRRRCRASERVCRSRSRRRTVILKIHGQSTARPSASGRASSSARTTTSTISPAPSWPASSRSTSPRAFAGATSSSSATAARLACGSSCTGSGAARRSSYRSWAVAAGARPARARVLAPAGHRRRSTSRSDEFARRGSSAAPWPRRALTVARPAAEPLQGARARSTTPSSTRTLLRPRARARDRCGNLSPHG